MKRILLVLTVVLGYTLTYSQSKPEIKQQSKLIKRTITAKTVDQSDQYLEEYARKGFDQGSPAFVVATGIVEYKKYYRSIDERDKVFHLYRAADKISRVRCENFKEWELKVLSGTAENCVEVLGTLREQLVKHLIMHGIRDKRTLQFAKKLPCESQDILISKVEYRLSYRRYSRLKATGNLNTLASYRTFKNDPSHKSFTVTSPSFKSEFRKLISDSITLAKEIRRLALEEEKKKKEKLRLERLVETTSPELYRQGKVAFKETQNREDGYRVVTFKNEDIKVVGRDVYYYDTLISSLCYDPKTGKLNGPFFKFTLPVEEVILASKDLNYTFKVKRNEVNITELSQAFKCRGYYIQGVLNCKNYTYKAEEDAIGIIDVIDGKPAGKSKTLMFTQGSVWIDDPETNLLLSYTLKRRVTGFKRQYETYDFEIIEGASLTFDSTGQLADGIHVLNPLEKVVYKDGFCTGYIDEENSDSITIGGKVWLRNGVYESSKNKIIRFIDDNLNQRGFLTEEGLPKFAPDVHYEIFTVVDKDRYIRKGYSSDYSMFSISEERECYYSLYQIGSKPDIFSYWISHILSKRTATLTSHSYYITQTIQRGIGTKYIDVLQKLQKNIDNDWLPGESWDYEVSLGNLKNLYRANQKISCHKGVYTLKDGYQAIFNFRDLLKH